jgi:uncharacterized protein (DUF2147 family)
MMAMSIRTLALFCCAALLGAAAPSTQMGDIRGEWRNTKNTVHLKVQPCGAELCGTVIWAAERQRADARKGSGSELIGSQLLRKLKRGSDGKWRGSIFIPDINTTASATAEQLNENLIRVSGCGLLGVICRTQHWHRMH